MSKLKAYVQDSYDEVVNKVTWPTYADLQQSAVLVLVASLIFASVVAVVDLGLQNGMSWFYQSF